MIKQLLKACLACILCSSAGAFSAHAGVQGDDVQLHIYSASPVDGMAECLVGNVRNIDTLASDPIVMVWDKIHGARFKTLIPSAGFQNSRAVACVASKTALYVLTEQETELRPESSRTLVKLHQLTLDGKLVKSALLNAGIDFWTYLLQTTPEGVITVAGGMRFSDEKSSNFVMKFDANFKQLSKMIIDHGAYARGASAQLADGRLLVAGMFLDDGAGRQNQPRYAASLVNVATGKYLWSTRLAAETDTASNVQVAVDSTYGVGFLAKRALSSFIVFLDVSGRKILEREAATTDCMFGNGRLTKSRQMYVASWGCPPDKSNAVLSINDGGLTVDKRLPKKGSVLLTQDGWINVLDDTTALHVEDGSLK